jgi:hypothetical protein
MPSPSSRLFARRPRRVAALAAAIVALGAGLAACGGSDSKTPKHPHLTTEQNDGITEIATNIQKYCLQGGAHANIERELQALITAYQKKPTSIYTNNQGTESTMREVVSAAADELEGCGEEAGARKLRAELRGAG